MHILVDENIPAATVRDLRQKGHDVLDIRQTPREGASDQELWDLALQQRRVLITTDKGFAHHRADKEHCGLLIVTLRQPNRQRIHQRVMQAVSQRAESQWPGATVIMRDTTQSLWRAGKQR